MNLFARYGTDGDKPAVLEISKAAPRCNPDSPTVVLEKRLRRVARQSFCLSKDRSFPTHESRQALVSANPDASVLRGEHGLTGIARQTLSHRYGRNRKLSKAVERSGGGSPDVAFS